MEAIEEVRRVETYFADADADPQHIEDQRRQFVYSVKRAKEVEKMARGWEEGTRKNEVMDRKDHPVLLSREQVSKLALTDNSEFTRGRKNLMIADGEIQEIRLGQRKAKSLSAGNSRANLLDAKKSQKQIHFESQIQKRNEEIREGTEMI